MLGPKSLLLTVLVLSLMAPPSFGAKGAVAVAASGSAHWTIEEPNPFGVRVVNRTLSFNARKMTDGAVRGVFEYHQVVEGEAFKFTVSVTCINVYDGNRAKLGGVIEVSNDPTLPPGRFAWFQVFDNGEGQPDAPDQSSLVGFGNEEANEAFCNSPNLPRFGPWDVEGNVHVAQ
jgi:hypothetical protein